MDSLISTFHIDWHLIVAQAVNFAIVFAVLYWFALKPLGKLMEERKETIEKGLADAKSNAQLLANTEKEYADAEKYATRKRGVNKDKIKPTPVFEQPREPRAGDNAIWGGGQNGMNMQSILAGQFSRPVGPSLGKPAEMTSILPSQAGISTGPTVASFMKDQDNLQLKK